MTTGKKPDPKDGSMRLVGQALSLGAELVFPALVGWWLDSVYGSAPTGLLIGGGLGFVLVIVHALRLTPPDKPQSREENDAS